MKRSTVLFVLFSCLVLHCSSLPAELVQKDVVREIVDQTMCPNLCSGRGRCVRNNSPRSPPENTTVCICDQGWIGNDCANVALPPHSQFEGEDCPHNCSSHGVCYRGSSVILPRCYCDAHYTGIDCSRIKSDFITCPNNCSGFGVCTEGYSDSFGNIVAKCMCDPSHAGKDCSVEIRSSCPSGCSGHGQCVKTKCYCSDGWIGADCSLQKIPVCPANCSSHGRCFKGKCFCFAGFSGDDCSDSLRPICNLDCSGHGRCIPENANFPARCLCDDGWIGKNCSTAKPVFINYCEHNCSGHGVCDSLTGNCTACAVGWYGKRCEFPTPAEKQEAPVGDAIHPYYMDGKILEKSKENRGIIVMGREHPLCPNNCSSHGICLEIVDEDLSKHFVCKCDKGYFGADCTTTVPNFSGLPSKIVVAPTNNKQNADKTKEKETKSKPLFAEDKTSWDKLPSAQQLKLASTGCPNNCSSRGRCVRNSQQPGLAECSCYPGWGGFDCSKNSVKPYNCPLSCSGHGRCVTAAEYFTIHCLCDPEWTGDNCDKKKPPKIVFKIEDGFCPNHCSNRGLCVGGKCTCLEIGWGGDDCSVPSGGSCQKNCSGNGICFWGSCECLGGYSGKLCEIEPSIPCPNDCHMKGKCVGGKCNCLTGFTGDDCSDILISCPRHCSGHGECSPAIPEEMQPAICHCADGWTGPDCSNFPIYSQPLEVEFPTRAQLEAAEKEKAQKQNSNPFAKKKTQQP
eukprot:c21678_g1_i1.p1 GENE.c21678_g1_i1~~c21678_g1_i1.p1  ORF type:complete len:735 (-),score=364.05 c21678_g1_i1:15-2219(-)